MIQRIRSHFNYFCLLLFHFPILCFAQSPEILLEKGRYHYQRDQLDSAQYYYQQAQAIPALELSAVAELINIALVRSNFEQADSLIQLGDVLSERPDTDMVAWCKFKTSKGEYFRKSSQLEDALAQHQAVMRKSTNAPAAELIHAYANFHIALTFEKLSQYDSSFYYAQKAYPLFLASLDSTDLAFTSIYNGLAVCYQRANRLDEAKVFYLKSKAIAEAQLGPVSSDLAICLNNLSSISRAEENYKEAIAYSEQALKIFRALDDESSISGAYFALGIYHYYLGDYGRTKDYVEACIRIRERLFSPQHYALIGPYELLGIAHEESGDYEKTLYYLAKGREKIIANYPKGSIPEGFNYENTALAFKSTQQLDSALHYMRLANSILPDQLPHNDYSMAVYFFSYANILYQLDLLDQASGMLEKSNAVYEALGLHQSAEYSQNIALQGSIEAEKENWVAADQKFELALEKIQTPGEPEQTLSAFRLTPNTLSLLNEYTKYLFQKYQATAKEESLALFETYADIYLQLSDKFRKQFTDPYTKSVIIKDNVAVYNRNIGIYNSLYRETKKKAYLDAAYQFSEYGRSSLLRDLQDEKIKSYAGVPDSVVQKELVLKKRVSTLNEQLLEQPEDVKVKQDLFASEEALNAHIDETAIAYPRYYELKFNTNVPDLASLQSKIETGHNLVEYMQDDTAYYALVIQAESSDLIYLGNLQRIDDAIVKWKRAIVQQDQTALDIAGQLLYRQIWQPLLTSLQGQRVTIIPTGRLFYLNFEGLRPDTSPRSYLIYDYTISYALSLTLLFSEEGQAGTGPIIAVAPGFEDEIKLQYKQQLDSLESIDEAYLSTVRQPWSLKLANRLKDQFAYEAYIGLAATESKIKANIQHGNVLYFGTHAIANASDPLRSKLVLAKEVGPQVEDGYLHAYELYGLDLQAELAVLNACESGVGNLQKGEGMISLAYSLHYAGCLSTVMSLWKVDEKVNTQITQNFLQYLDDGLPKSEALRQSKLDVLNTATGDLQHPFYWGGMVLMGKDGPLVFQQNNRPWFMAAGALMILLLLGYVLKSRFSSPPTLSD